MLLFMWSRWYSKAYMHGMMSIALARVHDPQAFFPVFLNITFIADFSDEKRKLQSSLCIKYSLGLSMIPHTTAFTQEDMKPKT